MKGVFIKNFKMPENCIKCPMQFGGFCYVQPPDIDEARVAPTVDESWEQGKPDWCPLEDYDCPKTKIGLKDMNENLVTIGDKVVCDDNYGYKVYGVVRFGKYERFNGEGFHLGVYIEWQNDGENKWRDWWRADVLYWLSRVEVVH